MFSIFYLFSVHRKRISTFDFETGRPLHYRTDTKKRKLFFIKKNIDKRLAITVSVLILIRYEL